MIESLICPECGGPLPEEILENDKGICDYCGVPIRIVYPEPTKPVEIPKPIEVPMVPAPAIPWVPQPYTEPYPEPAGTSPWTHQKKYWYTRTDDSTSDSYTIQTYTSDPVLTDHLTKTYTADEVINTTWGGTEIETRKGSALMFVGLNTGLRQ